MSANVFLRSVPATENVPCSNSMSCSLASSRCAAIFLPFAMTLSARLRQRRAADDQRARAVGAHAELHFVGVAEHDFDVLERHAELFADDLREGRLVTLAVIVRADQHGHLAGRMDAHGCAFVEPAARAEPAGNARGRKAAGFDIGAEPDAAQLAAAAPTPPCARRSLPSPRRSSAFFEAALRIAAVVLHHHRRLIGIGFLRDHVAAADLDLVDAHLVSPRCRPAARARRSPPAVRRRDRHRPARCW